MAPKMKTKIRIYLIVLGLFALMAPLSVLPIKAQGLEQLLLERIPVPTARPDYIVTGTIRSDAISQIPVSGNADRSVNAIRGSLKGGLDALQDGNGARALGIRKGMRPGSLDRKILAWAIAISGSKTVTSSEIASIARDLPGWPAKGAMRNNAERALARESISSKDLINAYAGRMPTTTEGAIDLAEAYLEVGDKKAANRIVAPLWREKTLDRKLENEILSRIGSVLTLADHRFRMHQLFYRDRVRAGLRLGGKAEQASLAKARAAAVRNNANATKLLAAVAPSSKQDTGYLFAQIEHARRSEKYTRAAKLLMSAPRSPSKLVDPDEWWVEQRIVSRHMLESGDARTAYKIAAEHSAASPAKIIEAEFHAGWYALRFLKNPSRARVHFAKILALAKRPISKSRGHYWMGRASSGTSAREHFQLAARHSGTFYGQLAAAKLGQKHLKLIRPKPSPADRSNYQARELVRAIKRLEEVGHGWRAGPIYRHLARTLNSAGELAILAHDAERKGNHTLALQIGKLAYGRGIDVATLSWPIGAIPRASRMADTGLALAYAIARQESAFDKAAISPANARGLLQLLPSTAKAVARRNGIGFSRKRLTRDASYNATLGAAYLSEQLSSFDKSYILTFAAYNAGPNRVREWIERFGDPRGRTLEEVVDWIEQIPFTETRHYVQRVMENYQVYRSRISGSPLNIENDLTRGRR